MSLLTLLNRGADWEPPSDQSLTLMGVDGWRAAVGQSFAVGAMAVKVRQDFDVIQPSFTAGSMQAFDILGYLGGSLDQSLNILGAMAVTVEQDFMVLDGTTGVFDEGGLGMPLLGWRDNGMDID